MSHILLQHFKILEPLKAGEQMGEGLHVPSSIVLIMKSERLEKEKADTAFHDMASVLPSRQQKVELVVSSILLAKRYNLLHQYDGLFAPVPSLQRAIWTVADR